MGAYLDFLIEICAMLHCASLQSQNTVSAYLESTSLSRYCFLALHGGIVAIYFSLRLHSMYMDKYCERAHFACGKIFVVRLIGSNTGLCPITHATLLLWIGDL